MAKKASAQQKEKTLEQSLWDAANALRGNLDNLNSSTLAVPSDG